jgi:hypothetical protein
MAVKIVREIAFGEGSRGFRFKNHPDQAEDRKQYQKGRLLEKARFREGSVAKRIFDRLSSEGKAA